MYHINCTFDYNKRNQAYTYNQGNIESLKELTGSEIQKLIKIQFISLIDDGKSKKSSKKENKGEEI